MKRVNEHKIDEAFDDISHYVRKIVPKREFSLKDCRHAMVSAIDEGREKLKQTSKTEKDLNNKATEIIQNVRDAILDGAEEIKGIGLDIGNIKGDDIDDIANKLIDFVEEEFDDIVSDFSTD